MERYCSTAFSVTCLVVAMLLSMSASAAESFGLWKMTCDTQCSLYQGLTKLGDSKAPKFGAQFLSPAEEGSSPPQLIISLPLGVYLPPGIGLEVGSLKRDVPISVCLPNACRSTLIVTKDIEAALKGQDSFRVRFYVAPQQMREITFDLNGFNQGYRALLSAQ